MSQIPPSAPTRRELQALITRCDAAARQGDSDLVRCLARLRQAACDAAGALALLPVSGNPETARALDPGGWDVEWRGGSVCYHTHRGVFRVAIAQQTLRDGNTGHTHPARRYRVELGDGVHVSTDRAALRLLVTAYLEAFEDVISPAVREAVLDKYFPADPADAPAEDDDAVPEP